MYRYKPEAYYKLTPILYDKNNISLDRKISIAKELYVKEELDLEEYEQCLDEIINPDSDRIWRILSNV